MTTSTESLAAQALWMTMHDSAFPAGRMVHSSGMESWLRAHPDAGPHPIIAMTLDYVLASLASLDAVVGAHAWAAEDTARLIELDRLLWAYKTSANARAASVDPGRRLADTALRVGLSTGAEEYIDAVRGDSTPGNIAVVEGALQAAVGTDQPTAVLGTLRSGLSSALSVSVRLGRLGAMSAQRALVEATPDLVEAVDVVLATPLSEITGNAIDLEIWGMRHEQYAPRLFAT
ncbi:urease accessory protein UreF [Gordonia sp. NPDC003376]